MLRQLGTGRELARALGRKERDLVQGVMVAVKQLTPTAEGPLPLGSTTTAEILITVFSSNIAASVMQDGCRPVCEHRLCTSRSRIQALGRRFVGLATLRTHAMISQQHATKSVVLMHSIRRKCCRDGD